MNRGWKPIRRLAVSSSLAAALLLSLPAPASAQDYTWSLSLLPGVGTPFEGDGGAEPAFQLGLGLLVEQQGNVWARIGISDFSTGSTEGRFDNGTISYVNMAGEYQFHEGYYISGIYLGLGAYQVDADRVGAEGEPPENVSDTFLGIVLGMTGEFQVTPRFFIAVEFAGHILDAQQVEVFGTLHVGVGFHF